MHVCFSRSAIDAGTESVSHQPRSTSEKPSIFFETAVTRFEQTNEGSLLGIEISTSFPAKRDRRRQASAGIGDEETRSRILQRSERPLTWRDFCPFAKGLPCAGTGRNVLSCALVRMQRRREVRTWTSTRSDDFGFHQDPQQDEWSVWASQEDEAEGLL